jgi:hypothetical protein
MDSWMKWFGDLGPAMVDPGAPFGAATTVTADGSGATANPATRYTVIEAADLGTAAGMAKGCPTLDQGGSVDIKAAMPMG